MLCENCVTLIGHLAWPLTIVFASALFYRPLSKLLETIGRRITKFSAFKVDVELGPLSQGRSLSTTVDGLKKIVVWQSFRPQIVTGVVQSGSADYVLIDIGEGNEWLTSRLFLLAAILERSRAVRCLVFLTGHRYVGAASPRDVRACLGSRFLAYESAFASANGSVGGIDLNAFRGGLSETLVNALTAAFLNNQLIVRSPPPPPQQIVPPPPPPPPQQIVPPPPPPPPPVGWVELKRTGAPTTWEFADWVTLGGLRDIVGQHLMTGAVVARAGPATPETTRTIVTASGTFVALIDQAGSFVDLCDRHIVLESVARQAMENGPEE
jgi:hypothetical protein